MSHGLKPDICVCNACGSFSTILAHQRVQVIWLLFLWVDLWHRHGTFTRNQEGVRC